MKLVVCAMETEAKYIINNQKDDVKVIVTGIGKVNAATKLTQFIEQNKVDVIYNIGFAGASHHFNVFDIVIINEAMYHDFDLSLFGYVKGQVPGFPKSFISNKKLLETTNGLFPNSKTSSLFTGDYFMTEKKDTDFVCDMEGAALYQVASIYKIPILSIKVISDIIGENNHFDNYKKFEENDGAVQISNIFNKLF